MLYCTSITVVANKGGIMRRIVMSINQCKPGMVIAETIFNNYGAVVINRDTILDEYIIEKLKNLDIKKIKIYHQPEDNVKSNNTQLFMAQYKENLNAVKEIMHEISIGKNVNIEKIDVVSHSMFTSINENRDIVDCISQIRKADEYTYTHSTNVALLCMLIGKWIGYDANTIKQLVQAGLLHDIGKINISNDILNKPEKLTDEEFDEIRKHPVHGYRIVKKFSQISDEVKKGILMHHEREDGSGYPMALKGEHISRFAKIIAVADIYDAMTSNRVYREKESPFSVLDLLERDTFGVLDIKIVNIFMRNIASYYIGDYVKLSNGCIGEIVYINSRSISKPIVKVEGRYIDLEEERNIIVAALI